MKEKLIVDPSRITELLGTVGSPLIVISELIKNSIDAEAENINIYYNTDAREINIFDDGNGFSLDEIKNLALPGMSTKKMNGNVKNKKGLFYTGSKGLGLLSVFSLCRHMRIITKNVNNDSYEINWLSHDGDFTYEIIEGTNIPFGTSINLIDVNIDSLSLLTSLPEIRKMKHLSTYLYKQKSVPLPNITLKVGIEPPSSLLFSTEFNPMLFDINFIYNRKQHELIVKIISSDKRVNNTPVSIRSFDIKNIQNILIDHFKVNKFIQPIFIEETNFDTLNNLIGVPDFEGRILVYEKQSAGTTLKNYGAGVNMYVNDLALYNYLSETYDWLTLADFSQRRKNTRLRPHNLFGYVNLPNFNETKEQLKISNERADFIQDATFNKLMYFLKGILFFMIVNVDITSKNNTFVSDSIEEEKNDETDWKSKSANNKVENSINENSNEKSSEGSSSEQLNTEDKDNYTNSEEDDDNKSYEPKDYRPKIGNKRYLRFTYEQGKNIEKIVNKNDLANKIYQIIFELYKLNIDDFPYSSLYLLRALLEASTQFADPVNYKENQLHTPIKNILDMWGNLQNKTKRFQSQLIMWKDSIKKTEIIRLLNLHIHYSDPINTDSIFSTWKTLKNYIYYCIVGTDDQSY